MSELSNGQKLLFVLMGLFMGWRKAVEFMDASPDAPVWAAVVMALLYMVGLCGCIYIACWLWAWLGEDKHGR